MMKIIIGVGIIIMGLWWFWPKDKIVYIPKSEVIPYCKEMNKKGLGCDCEARYSQEEAANYKMRCRIRRNIQAPVL